MNETIAAPLRGFRHSKPCEACPFPPSRLFPSRRSACAAPDRWCQLRSDTHRHCQHRRMPQPDGSAHQASRSKCRREVRPGRCPSAALADRNCPPEIDSHSALKSTYVPASAWSLGAWAELRRVDRRRCRPPVGKAAPRLGYRPTIHGPDKEITVALQDVAQEWVARQGVGPVRRVSTPSLAIAMPREIRLPGVAEPHELYAACRCAAYESVKLRVTSSSAR